MSVDYSEFEDRDALGSLAWKANCTDCDWVNRRTRKDCAKRSADLHENKTGHSVDLNNDGGPFLDDDDSDDEGGEE